MASIRVIRRKSRRQSLSDDYIRDAINDVSSGESNDQDTSDIEDGEVCEVKQIGVFMKASQVSTPKMSCVQGNPIIFSEHFDKWLSQLPEVVKVVVVVTKQTETKSIQSTREENTT